MGHAMALADPTSWLSVFPLADQLSKLTFQEADTLLVDMGGGFGQQAKAFVAKLHELEDVDTRLLKGEVIVQEIPQTLEHAPKDSMGFTFQVHDFFTPQPVKGAKFYYLRHILHDWSDEDCVRILENIVPAMGPESKVVIDEVVLPDEGVPWQAAYSDLIMLASLGGRERTKGEYEELLGKVGLRVEGVWRYDGRMQSALLAVKK